LLALVIWPYYLGADFASVPDAAMIPPTAD